MKKRRLVIVILLFVTLFAVYFYPLNMYIMKPGSAYPLSPLVDVENGDEDEDGELYLMTVAMQEATPYSYIWTKLFKNGRLMEKEQVLRPGETDSQYKLRQLKLMSSSQTNAVVVAFNRAGLPYEVRSEGVYITSVVESSAAFGKLEAGDTVVQVDDVEPITQKNIIDYLTTKQSEEEVEIHVMRNEHEMKYNIKLKEIPGADGKVGLGVNFIESRVVTTTPNVNIDAETIGGPSAGMMFTLQLLDQLLDEDLTKGYEIAGTGEILEDGTVGRIGGIDFKVMAAAEQGIEIFFAPDDEISADLKKKHPELISNYDLAVQTAKEINTKMKIVPVKTVDDALTYIRQLKKK